MSAEQQTTPDAGASGPAPDCPKCGGQMWDNRDENAQRVARGEKQRPDFKCKDRNCDGIIWPPRKDGAGAPAGAGGAAPAGDVPACPVCGGRMWDNREGKRNPKAPDFKCRDKACTGVIWPPRPGEAPRRPAAGGARPPAPRPSPGAARAPEPPPYAAAHDRPFDDAEAPDDDDLPF